MDDSKPHDDTNDGSSDKEKYDSTDYELINQLSDILENDDEDLVDISNYNEDDHAENSDATNSDNNADKEQENEQDDEKKYAIYDDPDQGTEDDKDGNEITDDETDQEDDTNEEDLNDIEEDDNNVSYGDVYTAEDHKKEISDEDLNNSEDDENDSDSDDDLYDIDSNKSDDDVQRHDDNGYSDYNDYPEQSKDLLQSSQRSNDIQNATKTEDVADEQNSPRWGNYCMEFFTGYQMKTCKEHFENS